jgi:hypothetical protein
MRFDPESQASDDELNAIIAELPEEVQPEVVLSLFVEALELLDRTTIAELRAELIERNSGHSSDTDPDSVLTEIIDGHLSLRDLQNSDPSSLSDLGTGIWSDPR